MSSVCASSSRTDLAGAAPNFPRSAQPRVTPAAEAHLGCVLVGLTLQLGIDLRPQQHNQRRQVTPEEKIITRPADLSSGLNCA